MTESATGTGTPSCRVCWCVRARLAGRRVSRVCPPVPLAPATASRRFLLELERRMEENVVISDVCDIVHHYAANDFSVYITYVSNQTYQERTYKQLL